MSLEGGLSKRSFQKFFSFKNQELNNCMDF